jgi:hypothetical protein
MTEKTDWQTLDHNEKLKILRDYSVDKIVTDYKYDDEDASSFRTRLARENVLWQPKQYVSAPKMAGEPPNKEVVIGAWRDLDRSEALLELIDNSIDAWKRRQDKYPDKTSPELNIYIDIDADTGQLTYEDNAGGVPTSKLINLVIPGHSDTDALSVGIGSYKTGGKKAIFRLATAVNIATRFWNPAETGDNNVAVHLDENWLLDVNEYEFPYYDAKDEGDLQRGQTQYLMQLRPEPIGGFWYSNPGELEKISKEIRLTYGLLMARNPEIHIYFPKRGKRVVPDLNSFYDFAGASDDKIDLRPQRVRFETALDHNGQKHGIAIEIVIGCRVTTGPGACGPGFDLYGNDRLFKERDIRLFAEMLPKGNNANLVLGWVNILGPNVFIPWDTHKRHLNTDRDVIELIRTHPAVKEVFANWSDAYNQISRAAKGEVKKTISTHYVLADGKTHQLNFPHSATVAIDASRKRGQKLPSDIYKPKVASAGKKSKDAGIQLGFSVTTEEARQLAATFEIAGSLDSPKVKRSLSEKAKEHLLSLLRPKRRKA